MPHWQMRISLLVRRLLVVFVLFELMNNYRKVENEDSIGSWRIDFEEPISAVGG